MSRPRRRPIAADARTVAAADLAHPSPDDSGRPALWGGSPLCDEHVRATEPTLPPLQALLPDLEAVWQSRRLTNDGPFVAALAEQLATLAGGAVVPVASGTAALTVALTALGIRGEVVVPALTFVATAQAVRAAGATPVLADVDPSSGCLTATTARAALSPVTEALLPVHLFGVPCDAPALERLAHRHGLALVFDAAHALGARYPDGRPVGSAGDAEAFSLHATKVLPAGEGGFVGARSAGLAERCHRIAHFGLDEAERVDGPGFNAKLGELPALLALHGLPRLEGYIAHRRRCVVRYRDGLSDVPGIGWLPAALDDLRSHPYAAARIDAPAFGLDADGLRDALAAERIEARRYFEPLHRHPAFASAARTDLSVSEALAADLLCIPLSSHLVLDDVDRVVTAIRRIHAWCIVHGPDRPVAVVGGS